MADNDPPGVQYPINQLPEPQPAPAIDAEAQHAPAPAVEPQNPPEAVAPQGELEKLKEELEKLRKTVEECSQLSVVSVLKKALDCATRPTTEFNKYEALDIFETLQNTARDTSHDQREYYRLAFHTARSKIDLPKEHFRSLLHQLLGDKNHQKVFEAVAKVEKSMRKSSSPRVLSQPYSRQSPYRGASRRDSGPLRCYSCNRIGHFAAKCLFRRPRVPSPSTSTSTYSTEREKTE